MRMAESSKGWVCLVGRTTLLLVAGLLLLPGSAQADNVTVGCPGGDPGDFPSIQSALNSLDSLGPHTITVTGVCMENVFIFNREQVTIQAPPGMTATIDTSAVPPIPGFPRFFVGRGRIITLRRLVITGDGSTTGMELGGDSDIRLINVVMENHGNAIRNMRKSFLLLSSTTIRNNNGIGVLVDDGALALVSQATIADNAKGLVVRGGSSAIFRGQNLVEDNQGVGVEVRGASSLRFDDTFSDGITFGGVASIEGNTGPGVRATSTGSVEFNGAHRIRFNTGAGVDVGRGSSLLATGGTDISNNAGPGVEASANASVALEGATVSNNTEGGVSILRGSGGEFAGSNSISGNGGADLFCDDLSFAAGDLAGITNVKCGKIVKEKTK